MQGRNYRHFLFSLFIIIFSSSTYAQETLWSTVEKSTIKTYIDAKKSRLPSNYQLIRLNSVQARKLQAETPLQNNLAARQTISKSSANNLLFRPAFQENGKNEYAIDLKSPVASAE